MYLFQIFMSLGLNLKKLCSKIAEDIKTSDNGRHYYLFFLCLAYRIVIQFRRHDDQL